MDANTLATAWGNRKGVDYAGLVGPLNEALVQCGATNVNRVAMFLAQLGHESGGGIYREEIASGAAYNGRADLGNTQPGDGPRFKGRSYIQITGRAHYQNLSAWAHQQGLVPTRTFFVDNPAALAGNEYVWTGAVWYFTVSRPTFMSYADKRDLETCTRLVNGGLNGLDDRRNYYNRSLALGDKLLPEVDGLMALSDKEARELLENSRYIRDQIGPKHPAWGDDSSLGKNASGQELTLRDALAKFLRDWRAKNG